MKKIAGGLRINLAQYRELAGVRAVRQRPRQGDPAALTRGERMVEMLKQGQYQPVPVEEQIVIIYAGTSGALDDFPTNRSPSSRRSTWPSCARTTATARDPAHQEVSDALQEEVEKVIATVKGRVPGLVPWLPFATSNGEPQGTPRPHQVGGQHRADHARDGDGRVDEAARCRRRRRASARTSTRSRT
jgi:hypothetical protein